jgi:hypothetical protein
VTYEWAASDVYATIRHQPCFFRVPGTVIRRVIRDQHQQTAMDWTWRYFVGFKHFSERFGVPRDLTPRQNRKATTYYSVEAAHFVMMVDCGTWVYHLRRYSERFFSRVASSLSFVCPTCRSTKSPIEPEDTVYNLECGVLFCRKCAALGFPKLQDKLSELSRLRRELYNSAAVTEK